MTMSTPESFRFKLRALAFSLACGAIAAGTSLQATAAPTPESSAAETAADASDADAVARGAQYKFEHDEQSRAPFSSELKTLIQNKDALARRHAEASGLGGRQAMVSSTWKALSGASRQLQWNGYYCGPAAMSMALATRGISINQGDAAWLLGTTTNGTDWYGYGSRVPTKTGYPMADALNYEMGWRWFYPVALSYNPTATEKQQFRDRLWVIDSGYPIVADAWEAPYGPHLAGHPVNQEIFHWYTIYGYYSSGWGVYYMDSASFAANGGWGAMASDTITTINGGRGYVY